MKSITDRLTQDPTADQLSVFRDHLSGMSLPRIAGQRCTEIKTTKRAIKRASKLHAVGDMSTRIALEHARLDELLQELESATDPSDFERVKLKIRVTEVRIRLLASTTEQSEIVEDSKADLDKAVAEYVKEKSSPVQLDLLGKTK